MGKENLWPALPFGECRDSMETLHMKMQVIGKVKLALTPFLNHWWNVAFFINASGMTTGLIQYNNLVFEINFDFINHKLEIRTSENSIKVISLATGTVADFYKEIMDNLSSFGVHAEIDPLPAEVPNPVRCDEDMRSIYEKEHVTAWWKILLNSNMVFEKYRSSFRGKQSPVLFYWGSFDLNQTRFFGKPADPPEESGIIMKYAENEVNFAIGFWHGNANYPKPAFYSYHYPAVIGIERSVIKPKSASFNSQLGEFILDYDSIRTDEDPVELILSFLNSTYEESIKLDGWDLNSLKTKIPNDDTTSQ